MQADNSSTSWLDRPLIKDSSSIKISTILTVLIILLTILSRFAMLGARDMSHDEVNHVWPSYDLFTGKGYQHNPVTHGPFQMHIVAFTYFLFGDSDFTSRVPAALFSTLAVVFVLFGFKRYLGKTGALIAGFLFLISPYLMFYGRYTRNEGFIELYAVVMFYAVLRHMDKGDKFSLFLLTGAIVMHFITKETSFIYMAQLLIFLMIIFLREIQRAHLQHPSRYKRFVALIGAAMLLLFVALGLGIAGAKPVAAATPQQNVAAATTAAVNTVLNLSGGTRLAIELFAVVGALAAAIVAFVFLIRELGWEKLRALRSFNLLMLTGTLVLPELTAFPVKMIGWDPLDYTTTEGLIHTGTILLILLIASAVIGMLWNPRLWLQNAFLFYAVYVFFYTTMFTNGAGFFSGIVGSLGYWLSQQGEQRGGQPLYYFALIQIPIYEYLAALGTLLAFYFGIRYDRFSHLPGRSPTAPQILDIPEAPVAAAPAEIAAEDVMDGMEPETVEETQASDPEAEPNGTLDLASFYTVERPLPVLAMFIFFSITALIAYSFAGEKMPWLTVHIALPMLLAAGWGLGFLVDSTQWGKIANRIGAIVLVLLPVFFTSATTAIGLALGANPPFAGSTLPQLQSTSLFVISLISALASGGVVVYLLRNWDFGQVLRLASVTIFAILALLTARTAYRASFINYDFATEFLVYAHGAPGPKEILKQVEEISRRTTKGKDIVVYYSGEAMYPYQWYFRDYPNSHWFGDKPTRELRDAPVVIAGGDVYGKIDDVLGDNFINYEYIRLWWPMQDYWNLTFERVQYALSRADYRSALWKIWFDRDYREYAKVTNNPNLTLETWEPSNKVRLYIRKDIIAQIWNYGAAPSIASSVKADPYKDNVLQLASDRVIGSTGTEPGQFQAPRDMAVAPDGSIYVADSRNNRIQHFKADGTQINIWGSFADITKGDAPGGTFNEPWDVAVAADGTVFVADTWNHRIQHFSADGKFLNMWGFFGQAEKPDGFWGPRALAIDSKGRVYVTDTGNKRVAVFEPDGTFVTQFGTAGLDPGQFDEQVGITIDKAGLVYVADTWNQRIQVFQPDTTGKVFTPLRQWDFAGWNGQSIDNKPFIKISAKSGNLFVADPEGFRVLEFTPDGKYIRSWGSYSAEIDGFGLVSGLAIDESGNVWVSDGGNNRLLHFTLP
jgi:predicted membrane-bound mannosyltransferase/DNA-binding beta-propeller fold protein YncE